MWAYTEFVRNHKAQNVFPHHRSSPASQITSPCLLLEQSFSSVQSLSHVRLCDPMNRSTPGLPVHHQLSESTQTHVHCVGDAIQPSHPWSSPSPALNGMVSSVQFSRSVVSDSLRPHESQHTRPPCPSPSPKVSPSSCPLHQ